MSRQYLIPGWGYVNEVDGKDFLIPGQGYLNSTSDLGWLPQYPSFLLNPQPSLNQGFYSSPTPQNVALTTNFPQWSPTFNNPVILPKEFPTGSYSFQTGAGSTSFPQWKSVHVDGNPKLKTNIPTGVIVSGSGANTPFLQWLPDYVDKNPSQIPQTPGWFTESTNEETATIFPQWKPQFDDKITKLIDKPNLGYFTCPEFPAVTNFPQWHNEFLDKIPLIPFKHNTGSVTFNPVSIAPTTFQQYVFYPDQLLVVPKIFPHGHISNPIPTNVVVTVTLPWLPSFVDKTNALIPLNIGWFTESTNEETVTTFPQWLSRFDDKTWANVFKPNEGWYTSGSGAGSTFFPEWKPSYDDKTPIILQQPNTGFYATAAGATATGYPLWQPDYADIAPKITDGLHKGEYSFTFISAAIPTNNPQWQSLFNDSTRGMPTLQSDAFIANVLYGIAPPVVVPHTGGHFIPEKHISPQDWKRYRELLERQEKLKALYKEEKLGVRSVREELESIINPEEDFVETDTKESKTESYYIQQHDETLNLLQNQLDILSTHISMLEIELDMKKKLAQDEEDIAILLTLM